MKACRSLYSQLWVEALAAMHDPVLEFVHGEHVDETSAQEKRTEDASMGEADLWTFNPKQRLLRRDPFVRVSQGSCRLATRFPKAIFKVCCWPLSHHLVLRKVGPNL